MKAGLLPRISSDILPVYLEATPDDTERMLSGLFHKRLDSPGGRYDPSESLVALLGSIRRGRSLPANKKLLLFIDQFEQLLYVHPQGRWSTVARCATAMRWFAIAGDRHGPRRFLDGHDTFLS